jgi:large subunit ribosomal protein L1
VPKHGKKYRQSAAKVEARPYPLRDAIELARETSYVKFDETLEVALRLGVDPKHADQMVRGTVVLPHGLGTTSRVLVFASGEKVREAEEAGADVVGGEELAKRIEGGWLEFDSVVATPDMMRVVGRLGKVLGPRGLMPNPKAGTVTMDVAKAVQEIKAGKVEFRVDKTGIIHAPVGKISFGTDNLRDNAEALFGAVLKAKPSAAKGKYVRGVSLSSTMGPGIKVDENTLTAAEA